jgi:single-stranded DNA-specific DHH superfamily exonuclease
MDFISGEPKYFFEFLNSLNKKDKISIVSHADLDGIASATILEQALISKKIKLKGIEFINHGEGVLTQIGKKFSAEKINKIFFFDFNLEPYYEEFKELESKFDIFVVDHHPSTISGKNILKTETADCTTFTLFELLKEDYSIDKLKELVCATMLPEISFKKDVNFNFMKENYPDLTLENIYESKLGEISSLFSSAVTYFGRKEIKAFKIIRRLIKKNKINRLSKYKEIIEKETDLVTEKFLKEAEFFPEKNLYFYYCPLKFGISSMITTKLSFKDPEKTFVFISDINDKPGFVKVSSRNSAKKQNMNDLMKKGIEGLENSTGGGHVPAAGASFMKKDMEKFKQNILNAL